MSKGKKTNSINEEKKSILQMDVKDLFKSDILKAELNPKLVIIGISILLGLGIYGYVGIYPEYEKFKTISSNLDSAESELSGYEEKLAEMPILKEKLNSLKEEVKIKSKKLSHNMEDGLFLIGLDKMIRDLDINLKNYTIENIVKYSDFYAIPMSISVEGDYRRIRELIYYLEQQKNITQVMDYDMKAKMTETKKEVAKRVYWTKDDQNYHLDKDCHKIVPGDVLYGTPSQSGGRKPDSECVGDIANTIEVEVTSKAKGDISANIKFIAYSSDDDILKLDTDNPETWKHGKYNPFQDTLN